MKMFNKTLFGFFAILFSPVVMAIKNVDETSGGGIVHTDYDKTLDAVGFLCDVTEDVENAMKEDSPGGKKIIWTEDIAIVTKNGLKAFKVIANLKEIGQEIKDTEESEVQQAAQLIEAKFGTSPEVQDAINDISGGAAQMYQGVLKLIAARKHG